MGRGRREARARRSEKEKMKWDERKGRSIGEEIRRRRGLEKVREK